jgi:hypothetical protein
MSTDIQVERSSESWTINDSGCGSSSDEFLPNESTNACIRPGGAASDVEEDVSNSDGEDNIPTIK